MRGWDPQTAHRSTPASLLARVLAPGLSRLMEALLLTTQKTFQLIVMLPTIKIRGAKPIQSMAPFHLKCRQAGGSPELGGHCLPPNLGSLDSTRYGHHWQPTGSMLPHAPKPVLPHKSGAVAAPMLPPGQSSMPPLPQKGSLCCGSLHNTALRCRVASPSCCPSARALHCCPNAAARC